MLLSEYLKKIQKGDEMNKQLLKAFIVKFDKTQAVLAEAMGISPSCLNAKINENKTEFTKSEMVFIRKRYKLSEEEFNEIFFSNLVS